jgi:uncharacterized protein YecE (DUF72 family)
MRVWLGTSGYSYRDWVGLVDPRGTRAGQMLALYSRLFPLVELNYTFYRIPTPAMLVRQAEQTAPGFQFLVKVPRSVSHEGEVGGLKGFREAVTELHWRDRLLGVLCEFPPSFRHGRAALDRLTVLGGELAGLSPAVEFRHRSWYRPEIAAWLGGHGLDLVSVDVPELPGLYPRGLRLSGPRVYVRFHSRNAAAWYGGEKRRYDYSYSDAELAEWVAALKAVADRTDRAVVLFNNCYDGQAVANAQQLRRLLERQLPEAEMVAPPAGEGR